MRQNNGTVTHFQAPTDFAPISLSSLFGHITELSYMKLKMIAGDQRAKSNYQQN